MGSKKWFLGVDFEKARPLIAVVLLQVGFAGMDLLSKASLNTGMNNYVLVVYRHAFATIAMAPFAFIFDKKVRTKMTMGVFFKILVLAVLEPVIDQNLYYLGMKYTTATFATALYNVVPAITFILACILRLEKVKLRSIRSAAKVIGTAATVAGAMIMTLVKGPVIDLFWTKAGTLHKTPTGELDLQSAIKGAVFIVVGCVGYSCFVILQAITLSTYPPELSLTAWICLMGTIEGAIVAFVVERRNLAVWSIGWDINLLTAAYSGVVCSGLTFYIQGVVMKYRGPVFVTAFNPLCMVIVAFLSTIIFAEQMFFGRVIGAIVICLGLYSVIWGKAKDYEDPSRQMKQLADEAASADEEAVKTGTAKRENLNVEVVTVDPPDSITHPDHVSKI